MPIDDIAAALNRRAFRDGRAPLLGNQNYNGYRATGSGNAVEAQDLVPLSQVEALIAAIQGVPTGTKIEFTGTQIPTGYLLANGQGVLRATYSALWAFAQASGNLAASQGAKTKGQYGPGDGSTTFTIPDLGDEFIRGLPTSGRTIGSTQADEFKSHAHAGTANSNGSHSHGYVQPINGDYFSGPTYNPASVTTSSGTTSTAGAHTHTLAIENSGGSETRPRNIAYPFLIKT